jgi:hypothetical protein
MRAIAIELSLKYVIVSPDSLTACAEENCTGMAGRNALQIKELDDEWPCQEGHVWAE